MKFGYALSSEEFGPNELSRIGQLAEMHGFEFLMVSDHYHPWIDKQGQSPFVWNVIGALSQVTTKIPIGTGVTGSILRIHPAVLAQAAATSQVQLDGRFMLGLGTGENLNEHIVGAGWPPFDIRLEMIEEYIEILRQLWEGGYQTYFGEFYTVEDARIYTLPKNPPPILYSAFGEKSAKFGGKKADGFVTTAPNKKLVDKFHSSSKSKKKKPVYGQMSLVFDKSKEKAESKLMKLWPLAGIPSPLNTELRLPSYFENTAKIIDKHDLSNKYFCGNSKDEFNKKIDEYKKAGFTHLYFHNIGDTQEEFIKWMAKEILPTNK